jgi:hypothetical protein
VSVFDSAGDGGEAFEVSASPDTAVADSAFEGTNVSRVAALSTMLGGDGEATRLLTNELIDLGFSRQLAFGERVWQDATPAQTLPDFRELRDQQGGFDRVAQWLTLNEGGRVQQANGFLVAVMGSRLERESAAGAAALWREFGQVAASPPGGPRRWRQRDRLFELWDEWPVWEWPDLQWSPMGIGAGGPEDDTEQIVPWDPVQWDETFQRVVSRFGDPYSGLFLITALARSRLGRALRSPDPVTRSLAMAAFQPPEPARAAGSLPPPMPPVTPPGALVVSTMIHGTWGWKGDWWRPRGDFHEFILRNLRPNLYSRGAKFSWSGAYSTSQRERAAQDFREWAYDVAPNGVQTLFAHSYGGEIAARAIFDGARVHELVLLSTPVTSHIEAFSGSNLRLVDVRLRMDPVLALARARQRIPAHPNLTTVLLDRWRLDHGATHREVVWRDEDIASRGGL